MVRKNYTHTRQCRKQATLLPSLQVVVVVMLVVGVEVTVAALLLVIVAAAALFHFCMNIRKKYHTRSILQARVANKKAKNGKIRKLEQGKNRSK